MIDGLVTRVKGFILDPVGTFRESGTDEPKAVFSYFGMLLLFNAILSAVIAVSGITAVPAFSGISSGPVHPVQVFLMMLIGGCIGTLIFAAWLHLWVRVFGGKRGIMQTITAVIYGSTPGMVFGWIPFISFLFLLWTLVLCIFGIQELQELSPLKAIVAVAIAVMVPVILLLVLAAWFMVSYMTVTSVPAVTG